MHCDIGAFSTRDTWCSVETRDLAFGLAFYTYAFLSSLFEVPGYGLTLVDAYVLLLNSHRLFGPTSEGCSPQSFSVR